MKTLTAKHSKEILDKMCSYVGIEDADDLDLSDPRWFQKHTWTAEQEEDYINWLAKFLKQHRYAIVRERYEAEKIIAQYGWKTEEKNG